MVLTSLQADDDLRYAPINLAAQADGIDLISKNDVTDFFGAVFILLALTKLSPGGWRFKGTRGFDAAF